MRKIGLLALLSVILVEGAHASSGGNNNYPRGYRFGDDSGRVYSVLYSGIRNSNGGITEVRISDHFEIGVLLFTVVSYNDVPLPNNFPNRFIASEYFCQPALAPIEGDNRYTTALTDDVYDAISRDSLNFRDAIRIYIDRADNTLDIMIRNNRALTEEEAAAMETITNYLGDDIVRSYPEYFGRREDGRNTNNRPVPAEINTNNNIIVTAATNPTDGHAEEEETEASTIANPAITALLFRLLMGGGSL